MQTLVAPENVSPTGQNPRLLPRDERHGARLAIRRATRAEHEATEAAFSHFRLSDPAHYRAFLTAHAAALPAMEIAVTARGWNRWEPRFPHLADDLAAMGAPLPPPMIGPDPSEPGVWGIQYVLEGSRLGGRILTQRLAPGSPHRYLSPPPAGARHCQGFCTAFELHAREGGSAWLEEAISAAVEAFRHFRRAAGAWALTI